MPQRMMMGVAIAIYTAGLATAATLARAGNPVAQNAKATHEVNVNGHTMVAPSAVKWSPAGKGLSAAVLSGSPDREGVPFVIRLKLETGTRIPPHWHPVDEHLTVVSGTFYMGSGDRFDEAGAAALTAGTYAMMPKDVRHFGWTGVETIVQIHGVGPFKTYFVEAPSK